jgi:hypothetical protein
MAYHHSLIVRPIVRHFRQVCRAARIDEPLDLVKYAAERRALKLGSRDSMNFYWLNSWMPDTSPGKSASRG